MSDNSLVRCKVGIVVSGRMCGNRELRGEPGPLLLYIIDDINLVFFPQEYSIKKRMGIKDAQQILLDEVKAQGKLAGNILVPCFHTSVMFFCHSLTGQDASMLFWISCCPTRQPRGKRYL